jgi:hypothetical protein
MLPITSSGASLTFCCAAGLGTRTRFLLFLLRTAMVRSPFVCHGVVGRPAVSGDDEGSRPTERILKMDSVEDCRGADGRRGLKSYRSFSGAICSTARKIALFEVTRRRFSHRSPPSASRIARPGGSSLACLRQMLDLRDSFSGDVVSEASNEDASLVVAPLEHTLPNPSALQRDLYALADKIVDLLVFHEIARLRVTRFATEMMIGSFSLRLE